MGSPRLDWIGKESWVFKRLLEMHGHELGIWQCYYLENNYNLKMMHSYSSDGSSNPACCLTQWPSRCFWEAPRLGQEKRTLPYKVKVNYNPQLPGPAQVGEGLCDLQCAFRGNLELPINLSAVPKWPEIITQMVNKLPWQSVTFTDFSHLLHDDQKKPNRAGQ